MPCSFNVDLKDGKTVAVCDELKTSLNRISAEMNYKTLAATSSSLSMKESVKAEGVLFKSSNGELEIEMLISADGFVKFETKLENIGAENIRLDKYFVRLDSVKFDNENERLSFFKNGYQSWTTTRSYQSNQKEMIPLPHYSISMQDNLNNVASGKVGEFNSELFAVLGQNENRKYLLFGQTKSFNQFFYIRTKFDKEHENVCSVELVLDFGMKEIKAGQSLHLDEFVVMSDSHPNRLQDDYLLMISEQRAKEERLFTGYCSWYYYYTKVSQKDMLENLEVATEHKVDWNIFVLDDGYQTALGDWLSVNKKFPDGVEKVAESIAEKKIIPGIWLAPFSGRRNSRLYKEHPEWTLKNTDGSPVSAGWNPFWGLFGVFYAFDVTHPGFQKYLKNVINELVHEKGFKYLKLDFIYSAALPGIAYDTSLSSAERLKLGLDIVKEVAGEDVILLGCGSPLSPAIGRVNAMRIGPDVSPYWFATYRYHLTRDPHSLCTKFAIRSVLNRCQMHRRLWINDPDCLMIRDTDTKLNEEERFTLTNAIIISGGMYVLSDKLSALSKNIWQDLLKIDAMVKECDRGRCWSLDYMEREMPELVYNSSGYLAVFNFSEKSVFKKVNLQKYLEGMVDSKVELVDVWNGEKFFLKEWVLDVGEMKPHSSRLFRLN